MAVYKAATSYKNPKRPDLRGFGYLAILKKLREQDPDLADEIERRGDQIYDSYDETERYRRRDSAGNKEPLTAIARAQEQAVNEYVERFPDIASFLQPETFREKDQRFGTTSEVADRELGMVRDTPNASAAMNRRKERLLDVAPNANLQITPTNKTNRELAEDQAVSALEIYEDEQKRKSIEEQLNSLESPITPVFSSTSSMSSNKAVASVEEDEDTAIIDEEDEEYYYDVAGPKRTFKEQTLSPNKGIGDESTRRVESETDTIPERPNVPIEEDADAIDEDVNALVEKFLVETAYDDPLTLDTQGLEPQSRILSTLRKYGPAIMQALGAGGESYFDSRAVGKANKANRRSQARANLINALSRGGGARGAQVAPEKGVGSALFKSLSGLGEGLEAQRDAQDLKDFRERQLSQADERISIDRERVNQQAAAKEQTDKIKQYKDQTNALIDAVSAAAESGALNVNNFEEWVSNNPSFAKVYRDLPDSYKDTVLVSAIASSYIAQPGESANLSNTVNILETSYNKIDDPGSLPSGLKLDLASLFGNRVASRLMPAESVYEGLANAFTVNIAAAFNRGRPSDADARAVSYLLPRIGAGDEANKARFDILRQLAEFAKYAANKNFQIPGASDGLISSGIITPDGNVNVEKLEEYRKRIGMLSPSANAQTSNVSTDTGGSSFADGDI